MSRTAVVSTALFLFAFGSNFCLLSVLAGGSMSCLTAPGATSDATTSRCCHPVPASAPGAQPPSGADSSPCCVTVATVPTLQILKADTGESPADLALVQDAVVSWREVARFAPLLEHESPPTTRPAARSSGRAPPLS